MHRKWKSVAALGMALLLGCFMPMNTMLAAEDDAEAKESADAPVIDITWQGQSYKYDMGGKIEYVYVNNEDQMLECSASQDGKAVSFSYYLDEVTDLTAEAKSAEEITWPDGQTSPWVRILSRNANYVLYVKAKGQDGQTVYARSGGIVVDTVKPEIVGVEEGRTYPEGTAFQVTDANLDVVMVNESPVTPESDGSYRVAANGTSCVIRAKDKAGNENSCSITVFGKISVEDPPEDPAEDTVISASGAYSLQTGASYQLAEGQWQVGGDSTVYQGGRAFYVKEAGDYSFTKR